MSARACDEPQASSLSMAIECFCQCLEKAYDCKINLSNLSRYVYIMSLKLYLIKIDPKFVVVVQYSE